MKGFEESDVGLFFTHKVNGQEMLLLSLNPEDERIDEETDERYYIQGYFRLVHVNSNLAHATFLALEFEEMEEEGDE